MSSMYQPTEPPSAHLSTIRIPQSCDPTMPTIYPSSLSNIQAITGSTSTSGASAAVAGSSTAAATTIQNPFECDLSTVTSASAAINSNIRSMHHRNPLSPFTPSYLRNDSRLIAIDQQYGQTFSTMMNPMQSMHATQTISQHQQQQHQQQLQLQQQQQQQQNITYSQTNFFLPIQTTNTINAAYFNANDQGHFIGQ